MEISVEVTVPTQTFSTMVEVGEKNGDWSNKVPVEQNNKRKTVSPFEDRKVDRMKRANRANRA